MLLLTRMFSVLRFGCMGVEGGDDAVQVGEHLPVHLGESLLATGLGGGDELQGLLALFAVLGQEFGGGEEHRASQACIRCPMLQPDPAQRGRLTEIIDNLKDRREEAEQRGWFGEIEGLDVSIAAAEAKLARMQSVVVLGIPTLQADPDYGDEA